MKKEEMLKLCKYYKGEKETPDTFGENAERFWQLECNYVEYEFVRKAKYWQTTGIKMASDFDDAKTVMDRYNNIAIKGMLAYMAVMQMYNAPYFDCLKFMLDYGKDI